MGIIHIPHQNIATVTCFPRNQNIAFFSTTPQLTTRTAGKYKSTKRRTFLMTYEMSRRPHFVGVDKSWMSWHTQNLEGFRQQQGTTLAQDEVVRRFVRSLLYEHIVIQGNELVIKRRGNVVYVTGFLQCGRYLNTSRIYWLFGFTEEILSNLLKQPVKLELQFVKDEHELAVYYK